MALKKPAKRQAAVVEEGHNDEEVPQKTQKKAGSKSGMASKLAEVDPDFCEFLKSEDKDLLENLDEFEDGEDDGDESELDLGDDQMESEDEDNAEDGDSEGIVPLSEDEEDEDEEDEDDEEGGLKDKVLKKSAKGEKRRKDGERALTMSQVNEWSQALAIVMAGEANEKGARLVIDQVVAALRCAADKIKPAEKGDKDPSQGKKLKKSKHGGGGESEDEGAESDEEKVDASKKKKRTSKAEAFFSKLFDYVGAREFHAVVKLCISHLIPSFLAVLRGDNKPSDKKDSKQGLLQNAYQIRRSPNWSKLKLSLRVYVETIVDLVKYTSDESVATELLAHLNTEDAQTLVFALPSTRRTLVQTVVSVWSKGSMISTSELLDQCHALILTTMRNCPTAKAQNLYERIFRRLYKAFMAACKMNAKRADEQALKIATAMRNQLASFVLVAPNPAMAHSIAFVRTRQLCSQLRAALSAAVAETRARSAKVVLSWPFLRCIDLWTEVVSTSPEGHAVRQLVYPLSQLTIGTARLQSSPRYYPLRLHCIRALNRLALATNTFIPTLSLILDVFSITDFNAAATTKGSAGKDDDRKIASLTSLIHFSESQLKDPGIEGGMLDAVVSDLLYLGSIETLAAYAHRVAFPELSLALVIRLKKFIKACHVPRFAEKMKVLLQKVDENSKWIEDRRRSASDLHPANSASVAAWENEAKTANPPMAQFLARVKATLALVNRSSKHQHHHRVKSEEGSGEKRQRFKVKREAKGGNNNKKGGNKKFQKHKTQNKKKFQKPRKMKR